MEKSGVAPSTLDDIETGRIPEPRPTLLTKLATALDVPVGDLFAVAGYTDGGSIPELTIYMRQRYPALPSKAIAELDDYAEFLMNKYGVESSGPADGTDEAA